MTNQFVLWDNVVRCLDQQLAAGIPPKSISVDGTATTFHSMKEVMDYYDWATRKRAQSQPGGGKFSTQDLSRTW